MPPRECVTLELEVDATLLEHGNALLDGETWIGSGPMEGVTISRAGGEAGHGFGFSEVVTVVIAIGSGVASQLIADALRKAASATIRKARGRARQSDGSLAGLTELIESERGDAADPQDDQPK
ncbi:hypothetical protein [Allorhizocola rhizosphaerae]|uniref:hypothetical protein n=1 Tax=Allorhizocola rhizosphaerae TaxID=1872709 RepID=UPI000E3CEA17|nr:hypothetical protein [Allorhizocola rhizosphaerae]